MTKEEYIAEINKVLDASDKDKIAVEILASLLEERDIVSESFAEDKSPILDGNVNPYLKLQLKLDNQILPYLKALGLYRYATASAVTENGEPDTVTSGSPKNNLLRLVGND